MKSFIEAQFCYCPLVWMFHHGVLNRKINYLHERSIRDGISLFQKLLQKDHSFTIHHRIIKSLAIDLYKINENFSNKIMSSITPPRLIKYGLRTQSDFLKISVNSSKPGLNSIRFFTSNFWQIVLMKMKILKNLEDFKFKISRWEHDGFDYNLYKDLMPNLGYVNLIWLWDIGLTVRIRKFGLILMDRKCLPYQNLPARSLGFLS